MIDGHGDDLHRYGNIRMNFSSNIYAHVDLSALEGHLRSSVGKIRSYPEPEARGLERLIAQESGVDEENVLVTSGATDAIYLVAQTFRDAGTFKVFRPTFSEYEDACRMFGYEEREDAALCWLCHPNNPTGQLETLPTLEALARRHDWLVIDQSYEDYTLAPCLSPQKAVELRNVVQLHSMTKRFAVPGLRLGYVVASASIIGKLRAQYRPWAVNALAVEAGTWLLTHRPKVLPDLPAYMAETQRLRDEMNALEGIHAAPTQTNFMLCSLSVSTAAELKDYLATEHGILIRDASNFRGLTPRHFRIAAQSPAEDDALLQALRQFLSHA